MGFNIKKVQELIIEKRFPLEKLVKILDTDMHTLSLYFVNAYNIDVVTLDLIAETLGVSATYFYDEESEASTKYIKEDLYTNERLEILEKQMILLNKRIEKL